MCFLIRRVKGMLGAATNAHLWFSSGRLDFGWDVGKAIRTGQYISTVSPGAINSIGQIIK